MTRTLTAVALALAASFPGHARSINLDMRVPRFRLTNGGLLDAVVALRKRLNVAASVELTTAEFDESDPLGNNIRASLFFRNTTLRELLDGIVELDGRYRWRVSGGVVHFIPIRSVRQPDSVMRKGVDAIEMSEDSMHDLLSELDYRWRDRLGVRFANSPHEGGMSLAGAGTLVGPGRLSFAGGTLRDLADALAATQPSGIWFLVPKEIASHVHPDGKQAKDWCFIANPPVLLDVPTPKLLGELRKHHAGRPSMRCNDLVGELKVRAHDEVDSLITAYWNAANKPYPYVRSRIARALAGVRSKRVAAFLLKALGKIRGNEEDIVMFQALGNAVSSIQPNEEALPILRRLASSGTADEGARRTARLYVRILLRRFPEAAPSNSAPKGQ